VGLIRFSPRFWVAFGIAVTITLFGVLGPYLLTDNTPSTVVGGLYDDPSSKAWLGTDNIGHDVWANLIYGTRTSLYVGLVAGIVATLIGLVIGTLAGYSGGWLDDLLMGFTNVVLTIPPIVVLILIAIALQSRTATSVALVIAATSWPWLARAVRAQASSIRTREHLDIARLSGARTVSLILFDVIPYMASYIVMAFVLQVSSAILSEAALSLLGLGPSNGVSLGVMLHWSLAWEAVRTGAWYVFIPPTLLLTLIAFALLMLQSSLDEVFNPRLRRGSTKLRRRRVVTPPPGGGSVAEAEQPATAPVGATGPAAPVVSGVRSDRTAEA
jgi:peptide/nickel transport system permease protein